MTEKLTLYFTSDFNKKRHSLWFKTSLYLFLIVKCIYWLLHYDLLFGENAIAFTHPFNNGPVMDAAFILYAQKSFAAGFWFIIPLALICLLQIFKVPLFFAGDLFLWFLIVNIHNKIYPTLTAGEYLLNQLLFFNIFISRRFSKDNKWPALIKISAHNFAVLAVMIQICFVYFFSALGKWQNEEWLNGNAVLLALKTEHYSLHGVAATAENYTWLLVFLNYLVLAFQSLFPILAWIPKIEKPFLIAGVIMHLFIAFVMGLMSFGFIMILAYIYFWPESRKTSAHSGNSAT